MVSIALPAKLPASTGAELPWRREVLYGWLDMGDWGWTPVTRSDRYTAPGFCVAALPHSQYSQKSAAAPNSHPTTAMLTISLKPGPHGLTVV